MTGLVLIFLVTLAALAGWVVRLRGQLAEAREVLSTFHVGGGKYPFDEALWQRVVPLLPPQQPPHGRSNLDHRRMVAAMLFVERTGCSWRALPSHFGHWSTIHSRYQRWRKAGLWSAICAILDQSDAEQAAA